VGLAHRLLGAAAPAQPAPAPHELGPAAARQLSGDLLPDWEDDWVLMERERFRQIRLHALENLADRLIDQGSYGEAVDAAMAAVASEPLRETAQRTLIRAYLTEGNTTDAVRQYRRYERLLSAELGIAPSTSLRDLLYGRRRTEL
ncbi:MAG TPA: bacterial transcriptional activator domain-containing protein, partial [Micromonosporaceae bacterium]|nr:bacterial transcriptional activator domain-containing protein [Micromonosporaceae bacterium]